MKRVRHTIRRKNIPSVALVSLSAQYWYDNEGNLIYSFYVRNNLDQIFKCLWNNNENESTIEPILEPGTNYNNNGNPVSLSIGQSQTITVSTIYNSVGSYNIQAFADYQNLINESNELNNIAQLNLNVN